MESRLRGLFIPLGSFIFAVTLAALAAPSNKILAALRNEGACTGIDIPQHWLQNLPRGPLGLVAGERDGGTVNIVVAAFEQVVGATKDADKKCKDGAKDVCVEVFNSDGPDGGNKTNRELTIGKKKHPEGSTYCGHYKAFVLTPCTSAVNVQQIIKTTGFINGVKMDKLSSDGFEKELFGGAAVPGPGHFAADAPGVIIDPDFFLSRGGGLPPPVTYVREDEIVTFFTCDGPVAAVKWNAKYTIVSHAEGDFECSVSSGTPVIVCAAGGGAAETAEYNALKKMLDEAKERKEREDLPPKK